jgi:hypothetical protein
VALVDDMVADPYHGVRLSVGEEGLDPVQTGDSRVTAAWMMMCGVFSSLLHLSDRSNGDIRA